MSQRNKFTITAILFFSLILFCFNSCGMKAEQKSLTSQFEIIDALISQGQMKDAVKELKKTEKQAYDSWSYIGIYKRYTILGEEKLSEKLLKKALKKNSENPELIAVYSNFLLKHERIEEAVKSAKKLQGTKYGSLYSEAIFKQAQQKGQDSDFYSDDFYPIYYDAYTGSRNPIWLRNCAVYNLSRGQFENAASLDPGYYSDVDDAYFWGLVLYDSGKYYESIDTLKTAQQYLKDYKNFALYKTNEIKIAAIQADAYTAITDVESAQLVRQGIVSNIENLNILPEDEQLLSIIVVNSAIYAREMELDDECADLLFYSVNRWPDYVPGLILYADFAYKSSLERVEDSEMKALRRGGIKSIEMEKYDNRRKIPLSDAQYRIDESIKRKADPYLYITKLDLKYKLDKTILDKQKTIDLWNLLEDTYSESEKYQLLLVEYAVNYLLYQKLYDDAWALFVKYTMEHTSINPEKDFWEQFITQMHVLDLGIVEFGGYFATRMEKTDEAIRIYEYCVYESAGILKEGFISPNVSTGACMNLANIYFGIGKKEQALDLYGKVAGREVNNGRRSEIFYRIACIYVALGDKKNALRSVDYACSIYPENAKASLLKDKITIQ